MLKTCVITVFASFLAMIVKISIVYFKGSESYDLVIAVLSARQNLEQRNAIRNTWLREKPANVGYYFVLGTHDCRLPREARRDSFDCKQLNINISEAETEAHYTSRRKFSDSYAGQKALLYSGFAFTVHHDIRINSLGILASAFLLKETLEIEVLQGSTKERITGTVINSSDPSNYTEIDGYFYGVVDEFVYPTGFEGITIVHNAKISEMADKMAWNTAGGVVSYKAFYTGDASELIHSEFHSSASAGSFQFVIHNIARLKEKMSEIPAHQKNWDSLQLKLSRDLEAEQSKWNDIIFVDCVDTYRALTQKLLLFYQWLTQFSGIQYRFVLKADDDTVVLIQRVLEKLHLLSEKKLWWGNFRKNWAVNHFGKWSDDAYTSPVYPAFACGAGYVLSKDLVDWVANNYQDLYQYQGEDVSLAIWLSAIKPSVVEDGLWSCDSQCAEGSYNRAELTVNKVKKTWHLYKKCGKICHCDYKNK